MSTQCHRELAALLMPQSMPMMRLTRNDGSLHILRGRLQSVGGAGDHERDGRVGEWQWVCCGVVRMAFLRWRWRGGGIRGGRDVGVLRALRGVGILGGARRADEAAKQWCSGITPRPFSFLFQLAAWATLQFRRLRVAVMIASLFLECALHLTLPPVVTAAIAHTFNEYCKGGGGGSADFAATATPGGGQRWLASAPSAVGGGQKCLGIAMAVAARPVIVPLDRRPSLARSRMARIEAAQTDGGGSGGGAIDGGQWLGIISRSLACSCDDELAAGWTTVPWRT